MPKSLTAKVVRLAYEKPELREQLLPLLREAGFKDTLEKLWKSYKKEHPKSEKPPQSLIDKAKGTGESKKPESRKETQDPKPEPPRREEPKPKPSSIWDEPAQRRQREQELERAKHEDLGNVAPYGKEPPPKTPWD